MKVLLDTNILIHREANSIVNDEIGNLFNWIDKLHYEKWIHPLSLTEIEKHSDKNVVKTFKTKLQNYNVLKTEAKETPEISVIRKKFDKNDNDNIDTSLIKELFSKRVDFLITEDRKIHEKANELKISDRVFTIDGFLEKVTTENPTLSEYKVLSVMKTYFGNVNLDDHFFDSFKEDYPGFEAWFNKKASEEAYVCLSDKKEVLAFLYVKKEKEDENYSDIVPIFHPKIRLKIGTFKVISNGFRLGERFLKIVFDNALRNEVDEIYVTVFNKREEHIRLIGLLSDWGFESYGEKKNPYGNEEVHVKNFHLIPNKQLPKLTYPFMSVSDDRQYLIVPIHPEYHTELLPDSILNNESAEDFVENAPHRNAIEKVYVCRSVYRDLQPGDIIVFYRTKTRMGPAFYTSVTTTIGIVSDVINNISNSIEFINLCHNRSVFSDTELTEIWNRNLRNKPFIINFLYLYSFPRRLNLQALINLGVIANVHSAPMGFKQITLHQFQAILRGSNSNESFIVN
ncbi:MAG: PIN domain-containing protein [bacterium]